MAYPKPENWTLATSERAIKKLHKLFQKYENLIEYDDLNNQLNPQADELYQEGFILQEQIPVQDMQTLKYNKLFI